MRGIASLTALIVGVGFLASLNAEAAKLEPIESYDPQINPAEFSTTITNPFFSLPTGKKLVYQQQTEDGMERLEIMIPGWTYTIMGVETLAYWNRVFLDGELKEDTRDYLAQNTTTGDVWYFGEHVDNYEDGKLHDHDGTWFAGEGTAKPGRWFIADPKAGDQFVHEFKGSKTYDTVEILGTEESITVPSGTYTHCVKTFAASNPSGTTANYYFCKDIADIALEVDLKGPETPEDSRIELIEIDPRGALGVALPDAYAKQGLKAPKAE